MACTWKYTLCVEPFSILVHIHRRNVVYLYAEGGLCITFCFNFINICALYFFNKMTFQSIEKWFSWWKWNTQNDVMLIFTEKLSKKSTKQNALYIKKSVDIFMFTIQCGKELIWIGNIFCRSHWFPFPLPTKTTGNHFNFTLTRLNPLVLCV